jgi:hypothetical protein
MYYTNLTFYDIVKLLVMQKIIIPRLEYGELSFKR